MEGNSNTNTLKNQMQNHPSYLPFFAGDRFYLISDCNDVKEIITKHGGLLVDNIPDSTIIVLGQHQARTKSIKEMVVKERGNGRQPILKEMWILVCDSQNDDVYYDGFLIQTKESDAIPMAAIDSQGEASAHAEEAEISAFKDKDSQLPPHPEAQVQGHHSPEFDSNITADKQNKTANSAARMESTAEVVGIMLGEEMENALVNIWAKHHPEMKKKEIYAELHRQFPDAPYHYFKNLRRTNKARLSARIKSCRKLLSKADVKTEFEGPGDQTENLEDHDLGESGSQPNVPPTPTTPSLRPTSRSVINDLCETNSTTPPAPVIAPVFMIGNRSRFLPEEKAWVLALWDHRIRQNPSLTIAGFASELHYKRKSHSIGSWANYLREIGLIANNQRSISPTSELHQDSPVQCTTPPPPPIMGSRDEQNPPKIGENAIRWMLELYRHRCTLDESISSEDLVEELASKTGYSQAQWRKRVANHGMDLAAIRREVMQERRGCENLETDDTEAEEGPISRRVGKQRSLSNQSIRRRYTEEEVNAMAKHLSKYSRGERSSIRVWEEYRHQHPHRTVGAYQQHYSKFRQKLDNLAYAYRYKGETQQTRVSKNQFSSKRVPHRRLLYRRWELDAMARHLSIYGPGASGMSIWRDFAVEYPHRSASAWAQAHTTRSEYLNERASKLRRANIRAQTRKLDAQPLNSLRDSIIVHVSRNASSKRAVNTDNEGNERRMFKKLKVA